MNAAFWRGRRVLVTGHTGFKGSWLSLWLQALGAEVTGYALDAPTQPNLFESGRVAQGMRSEKGDVRDPDRLRDVMRRARPEIVVHMAAQSLVRRSYAQPIETYTTNVMGTAYMLEAARGTPSVRAIVNVTSDKCYENRGWKRGYRETDRMGGYDPYSSSKGCAELITAAYRNSFFNPRGTVSHRIALGSARAGNVIGGGDWAEDRLVADIMRAFLAGRPAAIRRPRAVRPWQHVLEPLRGYLILAERLWDGDADYQAGWNFGPGPEDMKTVGWIADFLARKWGQGAAWQHAEDAQLHEAHLLRLDSSRARLRLGWQPAIRLEDALEWSLAWYRSYAAGADMRAFTLQQVAAYHERAAA